MNESCHTREWVTPLMWMHYVTHVNASCHTCECVVSHMWMGHVTEFCDSALRCCGLCRRWRKRLIGATATHCSAVHHTTTYYNTMEHPQHAATHCITLQHTATHCNTLPIMILRTLRKSFFFGGNSALLHEHTPPTRYFWEKNIFLLDEMCMFDMGWLWLVGSIKL